MDIRLAENLKKLRIQSRRTLEEVAEVIDVSRQSVSKWERGESYPDIEKCLRLSRLYKVTLNALVTEPMFLTCEESASSGNGKYMFGLTKIDTKGTLILPKMVLSTFNITPNDTLMILGDTRQGIAIMKANEMDNFVENENQEGSI